MLYKDELAQILNETPPHQYCVTVPRRFLVRLHAEITKEPVPLAAQEPDERLLILESRLTEMELRMLRKLASERHIVSNDALLATMECESFGSLWVHKIRLTRKLKKYCPAWEIVSIRGRGYQLVEKAVT